MEALGFPRKPDLASAQLEALGDRVARRGLADGCHQARPTLVRLK